SMSYPADYGFVEGTLGEDGDPLDALVLVGDPTFPGCRIACRVVGVFHMADEKGPDENTICLPLRHPPPLPPTHLHPLPSEPRNEIEHFFQGDKALEAGKSTEPHGFGDRAEADAIVARAALRAAEQP